VQREKEEKRSLRALILMSHRDSREKEIAAMEQIKKPRNRAIRNIREKRSLRSLILMSRRDSREKEIAAMEQIKKSRNRAIRNIREKEATAIEQISHQKISHQPFPLFPQFHYQQVLTPKTKRIIFQVEQGTRSYIKCFCIILHPFSKTG